MLGFLLDALAFPAAIGACALIYRRGVPLWAAYGLSSATYIAYANISARVLFGAYAPSSYFVALVTFAVDRVSFWHHHVSGAYLGHTQAEVEAFAIWYPVIGVVVVPVVVLAVIAAVRRFRR